MFTGIIMTKGQVRSVQPLSGDARIHVHAPQLPWEEVRLGDSIATNGVCLTVVALPAQGFVADVSVETLSLTTVQHWRAGQWLNLELALTPSSRLGGHMVSGHVDGIGRVLERYQEGRSERLVIEAPSALARYIAPKGSIAVDGISLTVNGVDGSRFGLSIVPHTVQETVISEYVVGTEVNLEVDIIARYLERLLLADDGATPTPLSQAFLAEHGYTK